MDVQHRQFLTNEQQVELREWEKYFDMPAREWVVESAKAREEQLIEFLVSGASNEAEMWEARGQIAVLKYIQQLDRLIEANFNQLTESAALTAADIEESQGANS